MALHRPAHARSGLGRYTAPRRLHPAHAAPSVDGLRFARLAGAVVGGGILAGAGLMGLIGTPAGALTFGPETSPPFSGSVTEIDGSGNSATLAGGGGSVAFPATVTAVAGLNTGNDNNTAYSDAVGPRTTARSEAGGGTTAIDDFNSASATALFGGSTLAPIEAVAGAGVGSDAIDSHNSSTAWTFGGAATTLAGVGIDAIDSGNLAWAGSQFGLAVSDAGVGEDAIDSGNLSYAYSLLGTSSSYAGVGTGVRRDNLAISQDLGGGSALACSGTQVVGVTCIEALAPVDLGDPSNNLATADAAAGGQAVAFAGSPNPGGSHNAAAALAVKNATAAAQAAGTGSEASAWAVGGPVTQPTTTASAQAIGVGADADTYAQGGGSLTGASAAATQIPGTSTVAASSGLGGDAFASNSGGLWTVSLNGNTLIS
jgi:hypothetical protein